MESRDREGGLHRWEGRRIGIGYRDRSRAGNRLKRSGRMSRPIYKYIKDLGITIPVLVWGSLSCIVLGVIYGCMFIKIL